MIITITGDPGSGKTSVAKILSARLDMPWKSMGDLRGRIALERGLTIDELNRLGESDPATDSAVDDLQKRLGETEDNFIIEGRLSWFFIPRSFKIYLACDPEESARRVFDARKFEAGRDDEAQYASVEETRRELERRSASDARRYERYYGLKGIDKEKFDLVIDTTTHDRPDVTVDKIIVDLKVRGFIAGDL